MPFVETALFGDDSQEAILHFGSITLRVVGTGDLVPTFYSYDKVYSQKLLPIPMTEVSGREPNRLSNFKAQRAVLRLETTKINEHFSINRIVLFAKKMYTSFPQ